MPPENKDNFEIFETKSPNGKNDTTNNNEK